MTPEENELSIIGATEYITVDGIQNVPAKIDTGADSSAVWASNIDMKKGGTLVFTLFDETSPLYTGKKIETTDFRAKLVRSAHGDVQFRYRVILPVVINGKSFETTFTLADRSKNNFPVLIGRRTLDGKFIVDVSQMKIKKVVNPNTPKLNTELQKDPYAFHQKYVNIAKPKS